MKEDWDNAGMPFVRSIDSIYTGNQLIAQCMAKSIHAVQLSKEKPNTMTSGRFQYVPSGHLGVDYIRTKKQQLLVYFQGEVMVRLGMSHHETVQSTCWTGRAMLLSEAMAIAMASHVQMP